MTWLFQFKNPVGQLGRWLEELYQFFITIQHRPGIRHSNADGLSRIPEKLPGCDCYESGREVSSLPWGGCPYCTRLNAQLGKFEEEVNYVVPLTVRQLNPPDECDGTIGGGHIDSNYMARFGTPLQVHTDQGRNFEIQLFTDIGKLLEVKKTRTTSYRPSSNGQVERYNQMVLSFIRCYLVDKVTQWDKHLPTLGMSI